MSSFLWANLFDEAILKELQHRQSSIWDWVKRATMYLAQLLEDFSNHSDEVHELMHKTYTVGMT